MGRPKSENPRRKQYRVRLTTEEYNKWQDIAEYYEKDISELIRDFMEEKYQIMEIHKFFYK